MGKSGVITEKSKENKAYHNVIVLFKIYRSVSWHMGRMWTAFWNLFIRQGWI